MAMPSPCGATFGRRDHGSGARSCTWVRAVMSRRRPLGLPASSGVEAIHRPFRCQGRPRGRAVSWSHDARWAAGVQ